MYEPRFIIYKMMFYGFILHSFLFFVGLSVDNLLLAIYTCGKCMKVYLYRCIKQDYFTSCLLHISRTGSYVTLKYILKIPFWDGITQFLHFLKYVYIIRYVIIQVLSHQHVVTLDMDGNTYFNYLQFKWNLVIFHF